MSSLDSASRSRRAQLGALGMLSPLFTLFTTPVQLMRSFWSLLILREQPWKHYLRMSSHRSLNSSFHRAYDILLDRYGVNGYAYEISLGRVAAIQFALTKLSMRAYRFAETLVPPVGALIGILLQLVWLSSNAEQELVLLTVLLTLISPLFYLCAFEALKYDSLGWSLVPLGYYALFTENLWLFAGTLLAISFLSFSVVVVQGALWFPLAIFLSGPWGILAFVPAGLKLLTHFSYFLRTNVSQLLNTLSGIGFTRKGAKIRRLRITRRSGYFLFLWICSSVLAFLISPALQGNIALLWLLTAPIALYLVNVRFSRYADEQTLYMLLLFAFSTCVIQSGEFLLLIPLWFAIAPTPRAFPFVDEQPSNSLFWSVPLRRPYQRTTLDAHVEPFFARIKPHERIFFQFDFKDDAYPEFDGLRAIKEYLAFCALEKHAFLFPDFYAVFDSFADRFPLLELYKDSSPAGRLAAMNEVGASSLLISSPTNKAPEDLQKHGFTVESVLDLKAGVAKGLWSSYQFDKNNPFLLLLRPPNAIGLSDERCTIETIEPNRLVIQLKNSSAAVVKFTYAPGWKAEGDARIKEAAGAFPWIEVHATPHEQVALRFSAKH